MKKMKWVSLVLAMALSCLSGCSTCDHEWEEANCRDPKTCKLCGDTRGTTNEEHQWEDATTDAPKTCRLCFLTEGEAIDVDERFTTDACKDLFGIWTALYETEDSRLGVPEMKVIMRMTMVFHNDGKLQIEKKLQNVTEVESTLAEYMKNAMYEKYAEVGQNKEAADAICVQMYGLNVEDFTKARAADVIKALDTSEPKVYYVSDGMLYISDDWFDSFMPEVFEITNDGKLQMESSELDRILEFSHIESKPN